MLRDLLLALSGNPGSIFKESKHGKVEVVNGIGNITRCECESLNRLLHLSARVLFFQRFLSRHLNSTLTCSNKKSSDDGLLPGLYLEGFCRGLSSVLLPYKAKLISIEKAILRDPNLSYLFILQELNSSIALFDVLFDVINQIISNQSHGCEILKVVYKACERGDEMSKQGMLVVMKQLHVIMYQQLSAWLLYGHLKDDCHEFYVTRGDSAKKEASFIIDYGKLPTYITQRCAKIILFIGTSLNLFVDDKNLNDGGEKSQPSGFDKTKWRMEGLLKEREREYLANLRCLEHLDVFSVDKFELLIEEIRGTVSRDLWVLCVNHGKLRACLHMLKDFYLLARGELFLTFIEEADPLLKNPVTRVTGHDVRQAFSRSALLVQLEVDAAPFQLFSLTVDDKKKEDEDDAGVVRQYPRYDNVDNGWSRLGLRFNVKWPLHILFKGDELDKYEQLFKFLLRVRRTQSQLQSTWMSLMRNQHRHDRALLRLQWTCRCHMQYFVDNLQYYLQADVLESHFNALLAKIETSDEAEQDFQLICSSHEQFLSSLLAQCFILSSTVCRSLIDILDICQHYCQVVSTSSAALSSHQLSQRLGKLWLEYSGKVDLFFKILTSVCSNQCNPHISQLTLRLDYNKFFSSSHRYQT